MNKGMAPGPVGRTTGPTIENLAETSDRVSSAYVSVDELQDGERVSNLCDVGSHAWCDGAHCACACHREGRYRYPKCYLAEGCGGDEACVALCPDRRGEP